MKLDIHAVIGAVAPSSLKLDPQTIQSLRNKDTIQFVGLF